MSTDDKLVICGFIFLLSIMDLLQWKAIEALQ